MEDLDLRSLAQKLPNTILHSRAEGTVKKYLCAFKRWNAWATQHDLVYLPAQPHHFALYLQHVGETTKSKAAVEEAYNAIAWVHTVAPSSPQHQI